MTDTRRDSLVMSVAAGIKELISFGDGEFSELEKELISTLVERDKEKKSKALVQVYDALQKLEREFAKINRPDHIILDAEDKPLVQGFTKARKDERDKLKKKIEKHTNALEKALTKGDFDDLYNLASGKDQDGDSKGGGTPKSDDGADSATT